MNAPHRKAAQVDLAGVPKPETVTVTAPNMRVAEFEIVGTSPLVTNNVNNKETLQNWQKKQAEGNTSRNKKIRPPKNFKALYEAAMFRSIEGWHGLNASGFRNAMIGACRLVGSPMTRAKMSIFIIADGHDSQGTPLVRIHGPKPRMDIRPARNSDGTFDLRSRPMWMQWSCKVRIRFDADQFSLVDVTNLLMRVGEQCGIGEGRPSSTKSSGMGWGLFKLKS